MTQKYVSNIFNEKMKYFDGYESFCYQNCLRIILQAMGYQNPELYVNAAMTLQQCEHENNICFQSQGNMRGLLPCVNQNIVRSYEEDDVKTVFQKNIDYMVDHNEPIIVGVDTYYLPYASNYLKNHAKHTLILCGFDLNKSIVYIIDWYKPWFYCGELDLTTFLQARESKNEDDGTIYSGKEIKNNWAYIKKFNDILPQNLLKEMLQMSMINFYFPQKETDGIQSLSYLGQMVKENRHIDNNRLYRDIFMINRRKDFFSEYLSIYNKQVDDCVPKELFEEIENSTNIWTTIQFLFMKQLRREKDENREKIAKQIEEVYRSEQICREYIKNLWGKL